MKWAPNLTSPQPSPKEMEQNESPSAGARLQRVTS